MFKKWGLSAAALLLTTAVVLPGCGKKEEPKEALQQSASKVAAMESYGLTSKLVINNLTIDTPNEDADMTQVLSMLKNAELSVTGVYQAKPMQTEMTMVLNLKGDMAMSFTVPMVMTTEKMFVKIPSIPFLPLPETVVGKFLELDLKELAEQEGAEFNPATMDTKKTQELSNEVMTTLLDQYDQKKYFKDISVKDANLPEGVDARQVVQFQVTNDNVKEAITILVNDALPKIIDILSKEEYRNMLQIDQKDLDQAKSEIQSGETRSELDKGLADLHKYLTVNKFVVNTAIDKKDYPVYQDVDMDINMNNPDDNTKIGLSMKASNHYSKINEKPVFQYGIPSGDEVITQDQLMEEFGTSSY
ncbi:hypothetical protein F4V43_10790 [Paenibacillus spiritus]|uniref:Lipoprotein n=1 Tax=Paenibacillus spiritus TaxID=2496557 RepID=A0A5J5G961_9BACL|nr:MULTISPECIES: hypothetical protein [Paenibacillus]KAA9004657.1 hypothetical protein F4V43_10790 [Paenibacillus spiritus]